MTVTYCTRCGAALVSGRRCPSCGPPAPQASPDTTAPVTAIRQSVDLLATQRVTSLRQEFDVRRDETALVVTRGRIAGSRYRLDEEVVTLGRDPKATVLLDDISVSRRHAEVRPEREGFRLVDLGSLNGTYVNGTQVEQALLEDGDDIQIGVFKLVLLAGTGGTQPA